MLYTRSIHPRKLRQWTALVLIVLSLTLGACGGAQPTPETMLSGAWVGKVDGTDAYIAIASNGEEVMAYICDGKTITQWYRGQATTGGLDLAAGSAKLQAQLTVDAANGSITLADGESFNFQATRAAGDAGLYRLEETVDDETWTAGWVVLNDGQLRGLRVSSKGTLETLSSLSAGAGRLDPDTKPY
jgi:hypothetical protein